MKSFWFLFCFPIFSTTIPTYTVSSLTPSKVSFSNGAIFTIKIEGFFTISEWDVNDPITFSSPVSTIHFPRISLGADPLIICVPVNLNNELKNSQVIGYLETAANNQSSGTRLIQSIDMGGRKITLDDNSVWFFKSPNDVTAEGWIPGDFVLIGSHVVFDASLINASRGTLIPVMEN